MQLEDQPQQDQSPEEQDRLRKIAAKWLKRIEKEKKIHEDYRDDGEDAWAVALDDISGRRIFYPLLWSVAQIEHSAVWSGAPIPDVRPRNTDRNPLYKESAQVMQRGLEFYLDQTEFDENMSRAIDDFLIAGLGISRVKVDAEIEDTPEGPLITEQMIRIEHVPWDRFGWEPVSNWDHCEWVYFEHRLPRAEIKKRWGVSVEASDDENNKDRKRRDDKSRNLATVYEIWDKRNKEVITVAKGNLEPLEVQADPLQLTGFFPCPRPIMTNLAPDQLIPSPDYKFIEEFDQEINRLYERGSKITEQIKATSLHDASITEIEDWSAIADGDSIAVPNLPERTDGKGNLSSMIMFWPNAERTESLAQVTQQLQIKRREVDELMGISDILRGSSNPQDGQETQKIKERWAGVRLKRKQYQVQRMVRDLFRLMSELTVEHVTPENLSRMTQIDVTPPIYQLLQNDLMREYAIDVESDSTIAKDEMAERRERSELLGEMTKWVQAVAPAIQSNMISADLGREMLQVAVAPYKKYSRGLDDVIEQLPTQQKQLQQATQQTQQLQGQVQQKDKQIEQMQYALQQFSQAEEARQNKETEGKYARDVSTAQKNQAGLTDDQLQAGKTLAETENTQADTDKKLADTDKVFYDMNNPGVQ
jgi:hypothetical protein